MSLADIAPEEIQGIATAASSVVGGIATVFSRLANVLEIAKTLLMMFIDPLATIVGELIQEIEDFVTDLRDAGVYVLVIAPLTKEDQRGTAEFISTVVSSCEDELDEERPQFSASSEVAAYVFLVGVEDFILLWHNFLKAMSKIFDFDAFRELKWVDEDLPPDWPPLYYRSKAGKLPDWRSITIGDMIKPLGEALNEIEALMEDMKGLLSDTQEFIDEFIGALQKKIDDIKAAAKAIRDIANALKDFFDITGVWYLDIQTKGVDGFKNELISSTNRPPFGDTSWTAGIVFLAGGPGVPPLVRLLGGL